MDVGERSGLQWDRNLQNLCNVNSDGFILNISFNLLKTAFRKKENNIKNKDKYFNKVEKRKELYNKAKIFYDESRIKKTSAIDGKYIEEQEDIEQN